MATKRLWWLRFALISCSLKAKCVVLTPTWPSSANATSFWLLRVSGCIETGCAATMILKHADDRSGDIAQLELLLGTAPERLRDRIRRQIANIRAGSAGERDAAHFLNREFGTSALIAIVHDLRIELNGDIAQIDHLVIHRVQATAWVLETKNYAGRLTCDEHGDWTVWNRSKPRSIPSPLNQARRQCELLRQWLAAQNVTSIQRIEPVVLISPTSSVDRSKLAAGSHVVKSDNFGEWRRKQAEAIGLGTALRMVGKHLLNGISEEGLKELGEALVAAHQPAAYDWHARFGLAAKDEAETVRPPSSPPLTENEPQLPTPPSSCSRLTGSGPWALDTPHGQVKITSVTGGLFAVRNEHSDALIETVKLACKGRGRWNPRYRNWLIEEANLDEVLDRIGGQIACGGSGSD